MTGNKNTQERIYQYISEYPGKYQQEIKRDLNINKNTLRTHLRRLVEKDRIISHPDIGPDGTLRVYYYPKSIYSRYEREIIYFLKAHGPNKEDRIRNVVYSSFEGLSSREFKSNFIRALLKLRAAGIVEQKGKATYKLTSATYVTLHFDECSSCGKIFDLLQNKSKCPKCMKEIDTEKDYRNRLIKNLGIPINSRILLHLKQYQYIVNRAYERNRFFIYPYELTRLEFTIPIWGDTSST